MSLVINYDVEASLIRSAPHRGFPKRYCLAMDAIRVLLTNIKHTVQRIDEQLSALSMLNGTSKATIGGALLISDVSSFLIDADRLFKIVKKYIDIYQSETDNLSLISAIQLVRNSHQHIEDRIDEYFVGTGDSIFGDLIWRFRANASDNETYCTMISGITFGKTDAPDMDMRKEPAHPSHSGAYDIYYSYVVRKNKQIEKILLPIDRIVNLVNGFILTTEQDLVIKYQKFKEDNKTEELPAFGMPPIVWGIVKQ
jgi:hypothetical protein